MQDIGTHWNERLDFTSGCLSCGPRHPRRPRRRPLALSPNALVATELARVQPIKARDDYHNPFFLVPKRNEWSGDYVEIALDGPLGVSEAVNGVLRVSCVLILRERLWGAEFDDHRGWVAGRRPVYCPDGASTAALVEMELVRSFVG